MPSIRATIPPVQTPTARLLELLELLQTRPLTTGREISDHLAIDARTVVSGRVCNSSRSSRRRAVGVCTGGIVARIEGTIRPIYLVRS